MVHPVLTVLFDSFLIGSALTVLAGMAAEYRASRVAAIGGRGTRPEQPIRRPVRLRRRMAAGSVGKGAGFRRRMAA
ncbi:MAG: hypothetical protein ACM3S1_03780 [Hyphomicrobiales bacterium]